MIRKRLWALFLSAALIVTLLPAAAMAEDTASQSGAQDSVSGNNSGGSSVKDSGKTVTASAEEIPVTWSSAPAFDELDGGAALPEIEVRYGRGNRANTNDYNTEDLKAFKAVLAAHPTLESDTGAVMNDPQAGKPRDWRYGTTTAQKELLR